MPSSTQKHRLESSPFQLERNKHAVYDCEQFVACLGREFVLKACHVVRRQRLEAGVVAKTWLDNYVKQLIEFLSALSDYCNHIDLKGNVAELDVPAWHEIAVLMGERIKARPLKEKTKEKLQLTQNKLLKLLAAAAVVPVPIQVSSERARKVAGNGESRFTQKGWGHLPKSEKVASPYAIRIDKHRRDYDYEPYRPLGRQFVLRLSSALAILYEGRSTGRAKTLHNTVVNFLRFLTHHSEHRGEFNGFLSELTTSRFVNISALSWEKVLYTWRASLTVTMNTAEGNNANTNAHTKVKNLDLVWRHLATEGMVPSVALKGFKNAQRIGTSRPRLSLAQLTRRQDDPSRVEDVVVTVLTQRFPSVDKPEAEEFIRTLCQELTPSTVQRLTPEELSAAIYALNHKRLKELRGCAEADFLHWYTHWQRGQVALAATKITSKELVDLLNSPLRSVSERQRNSARLLGSNKGLGNEEQLGNALKYVLATQDGIATGIHGRYHHLMRRFGGRFNFHAYLHPHPEATLALWVLLLVDAGSNCEVVREMPFDCIQKTEDRAFRKVVFAAKLRAGGEVVVDELTVAPLEGHSLSSIEAVQQYQRMSAQYRALADSFSKTLLLLHEYKTQVHKLHEWTARNWFQAFIRRHEALSGLKIRPSYIRPSVLLDVQHRNAGDVVAAQAVADHSSRATTWIHYTGRTPEKLLFTARVREFQDRFQVVIVASIHGAAAKLGLSEKQFQKILSEAARTGLGVACLDPRAGVQPGTSEGQDCTRQDACHGCKMRWVVGTVGNIADLLLFNEYLVSVQHTAQRKHPELWEQRWLPWLVFSDIALSKLRQGETASVFLEAKKVVAERRHTYQPIPLF